MIDESPAMEELSDISVADRARFRALADLIGDAGGRLYEWVPATGAVYWLDDPQDASPRPETEAEWRDMIHPEERDRVTAAHDRCRATGSPFNAEYRVIGSDGTVYRWRDRSLPVESRRAVEHWMGVVETLESPIESLEQSSLEDRFRVMADSAPVQIWISDTTGQCTWFNRPWLTFTGRTMQQEMGNGWAEGVHPDDFQNCLQTYLRSFEARRPFTMEYRLRRYDGEYRWILDNGVPLYEGDGSFSGYIGSCIDITTLRLAELEHERLLEAERVARGEAQRASRMKDEFLATLSHEIRTPLNAIVGWTQLLRSGSLTGPESVQAMETIERNARAQIRIIEELFDMSRILSGDVQIGREPVDMRDVVEAVLEELRTSANARDIRVDTILESEGVRVDGDRSRLEQVVRHLLSNAVKFTPVGGRVQIVLRHLDGQVELEITDSGQGLKAEFLPYVFDMFRQADSTTARRHGGLGLGLAIVRSLVELHGGSISARSRGEGTGATFVVRLRQTFHRPIEVNTSGVLEFPHAVAHHLDGLRVLIVDDNNDARELVRRVLHQSGAQVTAVGSVAEALEEFDRWRPDVLVSDISMPGRDGYELIRSVRERSPDSGGRTPAIAVTACALPEDRMRALLAGFQMHIAKPIDPRELVAIVGSFAGRTSAPRN